MLIGLLNCSPSLLEVRSLTGAAQATHIDKVLYWGDRSTSNTIQEGAVVTHPEDSSLLLTLESDLDD